MSEMGNSLKLYGSVADWFRFALLKASEPQSKGACSLWVFFLTKSGKLSRVNQLNNELKRRCHEEFPHLGLHMARVGRGLPVELGHTIKMVQIYKVAWADGVHVETDVQIASSLHKQAEEHLHKQKAPKAIPLIIEGIASCPLFYPLYASLLDVLERDFDSQSAFSADRISEIIHGVAKLESWLLKIEHGFDFGDIPEEYHEPVKRQCVQEIVARQQELRTLRKRLEGDDPAGNREHRNPLNPILDGFQAFLARGGDAVASPDDILCAKQQKMYAELVGMAQEQVHNSKLFESFRKDEPEAIRELLSEKNLFKALFDLAQEDPGFRFPEIAQGKKWKHQTAHYWARAVVAPLQPSPNSYYEVPIHEIEHRITKSGLAGECTDADDDQWDD